MIKQNIVDNSEIGVRSIQSMPFNWLGSADFGRIVPFHVQELLPTDKVVTCKPKIEVQMLPLASPTFGKLDLYCHYFFCPTRLLWKDALDYLSQSGAGQNAIPPHITTQRLTQRYQAADNNMQRAIYKHLTSLGLPPFFTNSSYVTTYPQGQYKISALPLRAYRRIWWDYYRDPELISDASFAQYMSLDGGALNVHENNNVDSLLLQPLVRSSFHTWHSQVFKNNGTSSPTDRLFGYTDHETNENVLSQENTSEQIRVIEALTRLSERLSLSGKRQIDRLFAQYGVKPDFVKMSMCEYIGGAKSSVLVSDITSSANTTSFEGQDLVSGSPLGMKAGAGYCAFNNLNVKYTAKEHGYLIGVFSVMPQIHFVQGLGRQWFRNELNDWYRKELEHTGMVAIPQKEVAIKGQVLYDSALDEQTYAFTQPYYDYRRNVDILAGDFMKYHDVGDSAGNDALYLQSMGLFLNFPIDRKFKIENLRADAKGVNNIFFYLGGNLFSDSDDHFHLNIDTDVVLNRPMDGFAVPTLETTEDPHRSKEELSQSVKL